VWVAIVFGMAHAHLTFLQHGERNFPSGGVGGVKMPSIASKAGGGSSNDNENDVKSFTEKLIDVVDFLQSLPPGQRVVLSFIIISYHFIYDRLVLMIFI
jgi:hypothetical protein